MACLLLCCPMRTIWVMLFSKLIQVCWLFFFYFVNYLFIQSSLSTLGLLVIRTYMFFWFAFWFVITISRTTCGFGRHIWINFDRIVFLFSSYRTWLDWNLSSFNKCFFFILVTFFFLNSIHVTFFFVILLVKITYSI
jgi:hypothetical protein